MQIHREAHESSPVMGADRDRRRRRGRSMLPAILSMIVLMSTAGAGIGATTAAAAARRKSPFVVATAEPTSGAFAAIGKDVELGLKAEAYLINKKGGILGHKVVVKSLNDASTVQRTLSAARQLTSGSTVNLFVGTPVDAPEELPLVTHNLFTSNCVVAVCGNGSKYPYAFSVNPTTSIQLQPIMAYLKSKHYKKVGLVAQNHTDGQTFVNEMKSTAKKSGVQIVGTALFNSTATSVTTQLQQLKSEGAEALAAWTPGTTVSVVMSGMQDIGWKAPVIGSLAVFTGDADTLVPPSTYSQLTCMCFDTGVRQGSKVSSAYKPLAKAMARFGKPTSFSVAAMGADSLAIPAWAYQKDHSLNYKAAAKTMATIYKYNVRTIRPQLWTYRKANPEYHGDVHSPVHASVSKGFFAVAHPGKIVFGTYPGKSFNY